jgi:hypothetical protein
MKLSGKDIVFCKARDNFGAIACGARYLYFVRSVNVITVNKIKATVVWDILP